MINGWGIWLREGSIKINDIELKDISIKSLRKNITYIPQHPKLFNRTLYSNITYGINKISRDKVISLINTIKIESIKKRFLEDLDKPVGKYGNNLSGGQRQMFGYYVLCCKVLKLLF